MHHEGGCAVVGPKKQTVGLTTLVNDGKRTTGQLMSSQYKKTGDAAFLRADCALQTISDLSQSHLMGNQPGAFDMTNRSASINYIISPKHHELESRTGHNSTTYQKRPEMP